MNPCNDPRRAVEKLKTEGTPFPPKAGTTLDLDAVEIVSSRLKLRPVSLEYTEKIFSELTPEITQYMMTQPSGRIEDTIAFIEKSAIGRTNETDLALVILKRETGEFLGMCGLHSQARSLEPHLGIWIKKGAHGSGYGREAVEALCTWAWSNLDYSALRYDVDRANVSSQRIAESLGGTVVEEEKTLRMDGGTLDSLIFHIPRPTNL